MALYDYKCHKCGKVFEVRQKFSEEPLTVHESCGGELERLISAPAIQFKGKGWYVTDYGRSSSLSGKSNPSSKAPASSETKPTPAANS
jgi:putative FmdB family regulatory protein